MCPVLFFISSDSHFANKKTDSVLTALSDFVTTMMQSNPYIFHHILILL